MKFHHLRWMAAALTAAVCLTVLIAFQSHPAQAQAINCADTASTGIPQSECQALVALFPDRTANVSPCQWSEVTCTGGYITGLDFTETGIGNTMPDLSGLTHLETLIVFRCGLSGEFPAWIAASSTLKFVDLTENYFSGLLPDLSAMTSLEHLSIHRNGFSGTFPDISGLTSLQELHISENQFSGSLPNISMLPNLIVFMADSNNFSGTIHSGITASTSLELVMLDLNDLSGPIPDLSGMTALGLFNARDNDLSGDLPPISYFPPSIQYIDLARNHITGQIPASYFELVSTYSSPVVLDGNMLTGEVPGTYEGDLGSMAYNALTASAPLIPSEWFLRTQTIPPSGISFSNVTHESANVSWTPITYTDDTGSYQVGLSTTSGSGYTFGHTTPNKLASSIALTDLTPNTTYYAVVRTVTLPNGWNPNTVTSLNSAEFSFTTAFDPNALNCANTAMTVIPQAECEALTAIFPDRTENVSPCTWGGITCTGGHVTAVEIWEIGLTGNVPDLSALTHLEELKLPGNALTGEFPAWIAASSQLKFVFLDNNALSGPLPDLSAMTSLEQLGIGMNHFSGPLPDLSVLPNLTLFWAADNDFSGTIHSGITTSTSLEFLMLDLNDLSGPVPDLSGMTALGHFSVQDNVLSGNLPPASYFPPNPSIIDLSRNHLAGPVPASYAESLSNYSIAVNGNMLTSEVPNAIDALYNALTDASLSPTDYFYTTQTLPPIGISVSNVTHNSADVSWTPILYTADTGSYEVGLSTTSGSGYVFSHSTANKFASSIALSGLAPNTTYYAVVRAVTQPHAQNPNTVTSLNSAEFSFTTAFDPNALNCADTATTGIPQAECEAISVLFPLGFPAHEGQPLCEWNRITCSGGHVTMVYLFESGISGTLPDLSALTQLEELEYTHSSFGEYADDYLTGSFPAWIAASPSLKWVGLAGHRLSGPIPDLSAMVSLEGLDLAGNDFSGPLPNLSTLPNIQLFAGSLNDFSDSIPAGITSSTSLQHLYIEGNDLSGPLPDLSGMTSLIAIRASDNQLSGPLPALPSSAKAIHLPRNQFSGTIPESYASSGLVAISLAGNQLTGEVPAGFADITWQEALELDYNALTATDPDVAALLSIGYGDFFGTQTLPPTGVAASNVTHNSADVSWTPIEYTGDTGAYEIGLSTTSGSSYVFSHSTANKSASSIALSGLAPNTTYYAVVRTVTQPHHEYPDEYPWSPLKNPNTVTSLNSAEFSFTTGFDPNVLNCVDTATTGIPQSECEAISVLFPLGFPAYEGQPLCEWNRITCSGGHVTMVYLFESGFSGTLPDLSALTQLEELEYTHSSFGEYADDYLTGNFPAWIAASSSLKWLSLASHQLSGPIPDLSAMTSLEGLGLDHNNFSGPIPAGIASSNSLKYLLISDNNLSGPLPDLSGMTSLISIWADDNQFSGPLPVLPSNAISIMLSRNRISGGIPAGYVASGGPVLLQLDGNNLTGEVPAGFADINWHEAPILDYNALTATDPDVAALLDSADGDFFGTQTLPPTGITASNMTPTSADLSWTPILYIADAGAYEVGISTTSGGGYVFGHSTANKSTSSIALSGLAPQTTYYVVVRTVTQPHEFNPNTVTSLNSAEFSFTTPIDPVSAPVLLSPAANGTVRGTNSPVLSWMPNPAGEGVTAYQVLLKNDATGAKVLKQTIPAANCAAVCAVNLGGLAPQIDLTIGVYNWQVTATGSLGTNKSAKQKFSVVKPDAPVITAPLGTVSDPQPDLTWTVNPEDMNTRYKLKLTGVKSGVVFKQTVSGVCSGAACAVGLDTLAGGPYLLKNDTYTLIVKAINEIGGRKATSTFKVKFPAPAVNLAPAGGVIVNTPHPVLSWMPDPNASSFNVILQRIKNGAVVKTFKVNGIVSGTQGFACGAGVCTLDLAALQSPLALPKGNYAWKVVSSNPAIHPASNSKSAKAAFKIVLP